MVAELERAKTEITLLKEELSIKDARCSRVPPRRRPYYSPIQRMRVLRLKAARSWSSSQAAQAAVGLLPRRPLATVSERRYVSNSVRSYLLTQWYPQ